MIHQPYGQVGGQVSDIEIQAEEIIKSKEVINDILAKHTGQPIERIAKDTERDRYLTAVQAKNMAWSTRSWAELWASIRAPCLRRSLEASHR